MMRYNEREIKAVIGASYGDEGKGLMTAYFCRNAQTDGKKCLTVLHNGGAQRGHTVVTAEGLRHVFHHLSSGTFYSSDTYFADTFILNPLIFAEEHNELSPDVKIYYSPECMWSSPFDMMINQIAEDSRGDKRHGSCGVGIWETIVRYETLSMPFPEFIRLDTDGKRRFLETIRDEYMPKRLTALGINDISEEWKSTINAPALIDNFIEDCEYFAEHSVQADVDIIEEYPYIVFEGAQGLLLSSISGEAGIHTTPSFTGAENPVRIISALSGRNSVEVCYVTRTYLTRHGAGPFAEECAKADINPDMYDRTNIPNGYQGVIRYGRIDVDSLRRRIYCDFEKFSAIGDTELSLAVTHMNETDGMLVTANGTETPESVGIEKMYLSFDETNADI